MVRINGFKKSPKIPENTFSESQHYTPLSDTGQNNQESEQSIYNSLTRGTVNEERRRLAERLAYKVMLGDGAAEAGWRCCRLRVIVITMFFIPLWLEIKTQSRDRSVATTSALARLAMKSFLRPGFVIYIYIYIYIYIHIHQRKSPQWY